MPNSQPQPNVISPGQPPAGAPRTITATMKIISIVDKDPELFAKKCNEFLETIDNQKRFLNARNVFNLGDKLVAVIWYLEAIEPKVEEKPVSTEPLGGEQKSEQPKEEPQPSEPTPSGENPA